MFWRFGGYANISTLDTILDKPDVTLEELLDESDLIQELKQHNTKLIEYLRDDNVLRRLLEYVVAAKPYNPEDDEEANGSRPSSANRVGGYDLDPKGKSKERYAGEGDREKEEKTRLKYAYVACEVLSSETWSISEALMENHEHLRQFWQFLNRDTPLDPLQAGYFTKVNETLLDKKTEDMLAFFKSIDNVVADMLRHVDCPMVMDLLLKIISLEKVEGGQGIVDWLHSQDLIPILLSYLSAGHASATQTSAGDFLKAIITISANASQNEQSCIGPNDLTRQLVSERCIQDLIGDMLRGGNALTVGVGIIIEVIRKNNSDYDPDVGAEADSKPSSRDPIYLGTLLRIFAKHVPDFMALILSPTYTVVNDDGTSVVKKRELKAAFGETIEPLGFDRFKTCELMAELLHCSNMGLLNERGSEGFIRERDRERERLRAEGMLPTERDRHLSADVTEDSTTYPQETPSSVLGSESPEEIRRLEIANGGEEDGFEDVAVSGVLNDEVKDDFDEKPDNDDEPLIMRSGPTAGHGKGSGETAHGEFVDEPLSSPRMDTSPMVHAGGETREGVTSPNEPASDKDAPLSSSSEGLAAKVDQFTLDHDNHKAVDSPPNSSRATSSPGISPNETRDSTHSATQVDFDEPSTQPEQARGALRTSSQAALEHVISPEDLSPHPEDEPAPLFASRVAESATSKPSDVSNTDDGETTNEDSQATIDALEEEGVSFRSVLESGNESGLDSQIQTDVDGTPVVGDYLKMMFVEHRVVPTILEFFFRFPWNNFLHNVVYDVVQQVFNGQMERGYNRTLAVDLFETGCVTNRIVEGQQRSDRAQAETNMRLGYMGHLTLIAEEVVKFTERHPSEFLSKSVLDKVMAGEWIDYVERVLAETRERDNAILGGVRPDMSVGPRQAVINSLNAAQGFGNGPSTALANAGLTGGNPGLDSLDLVNGNASTGGNFNLSGGSLLSGFGSSSDEEDEEMEEENDEDGARGTNTNTADHFSSFSTVSPSHSPATTTPAADVVADQGESEAATTNPPTALPPPPPPPLNIPPSRARRQLAARLAMTKAKKDEEARAHIAAQGTHSAADQGDGAGGTGAASHFSIGGFDNEIDEDDPSWGPDEENASGRSPLSTPSSPSSSSPSPSPTSSEEDEDEDEEEDDDLALPPRRSSDSHTNSGHTAGSTGSGKRRRPSETTAAVTRTAIDDDDEDEDDEEEDEDEVRAEEVRELLGEIEMEVGGRARGSSRGEVVGKAKSGTG